MTYALDTTTIIQLLRNDKTVCSKRDNALEKGSELVIPIISDYEIRRGFYYQSAPRKERIYQLLCNEFSVVDVSRDIWNHAARLYANLRSAGYTIGDADILIASLCIVGDYTLVSTNIKHYEIIKDLQLVNWAE
jgi:tRNA(fMet)-specific endonuclease VapC